MSPQDDSAETLDILIGQCLESNQQAQRELFQRYRKLYYGLAYKSLGPKFDLDEVVHEIFIQLFKGLSSFQHKSSFDTWAYRIGLNVCVSWLRRKLKKRQLDVVSESEIPESRSVSTGSTPVDDMLHRELERKIFEALSRLDEKKRVVIILHDMEKKSLDEIAEIVQKPVGTVKSRLFHGRNEMKKLLDTYLKS